MVRYKERFLVARLCAAGPAKLSAAALKRALEEQLVADFGTFGCAQTSRALQVRAFHARSGLLVLRCKREALRQVWAALTFLAKVEQTRVCASVLTVASSRRTCKMKVAQALRKACERTVAENVRQAVLDEALQRAEQALMQPRLDSLATDGRAPPRPRPVLAPSSPLPKGAIKKEAFLGDCPLFGDCPRFGDCLRFGAKQDEDSRRGTPCLRAADAS
eukprot:scaffold1944_cov241-Pinguiococcus_pyrenoidosus.AAC.4